jgi:RNA polymerase sigma factor (sigma-70 family)
MLVYTITTLEDVMRDETTEMVEALIDVKEAMSALTPKQRQVLDLWLQGHTQRDIGERLGIIQSSVCRRLQNAFATMRQVVG